MSTISCLTCKQSYFEYILFLVFIQVHWNYTDVLPIWHENLTSYHCAYRKFSSRWNLFIKIVSSKGFWFCFSASFYRSEAYILFSLCCPQTLKKIKLEIHLKWWCLQMLSWSEFFNLEHCLWRNQSSSRNCWTVKRYDSENSLCQCRRGRVHSSVFFENCWVWRKLLDSTNGWKEINLPQYPYMRTIPVSIYLRYQLNVVGKFLCSYTFFFRIQYACVHLTI